MHCSSPLITDHWLSIDYETEGFKITRLEFHKSNEERHDLDKKIPSNQLTIYLSWFKNLLEEKSLSVEKMLCVDESFLLVKVFCWWKLFIDESCLLMKVFCWWKLSVDESFLLMKVVYWWKLCIDESCLIMKVMYRWKLFTDKSCLLKVFYWWKLSIIES